MPEPANSPHFPCSGGTAPPASPDARHGRCRRRGGRLAAGLIGLGLAAAGGALVLRASGPIPSHGFGPAAFAGHSFCAGNTDKHVARAVGWLVDDVKGTPEQEQQLTAIAKSAVADLCALKSQARENHLQAVALLTQETVDRAALEAVRAKQMELANAASSRLTRAVADAADVLTPSQRVDLAARLKKIHG